jgi:hypothetical protein
VRTQQLRNGCGTRAIERGLLRANALQCRVGLVTCALRQLVDRVAVGVTNPEAERSRTTSPRQRVWSSQADDASHAPPLLDANDLSIFTTAV